MYVNHYQLAEDPFRFSPDEYEPYQYRSYSSAVAFLQHVIDDDAGMLILLSGVTGVGKSTLINDILQKQNASKVLFAELQAGQINSDGLFNCIAHSLEMKEENIEQTMIQQFQQYLDWNKSKNLDTHIIIEDAHDLSPGNLHKLGQLARLIDENNYNTRILLIGNQAINQLLDNASIYGIDKQLIVGWNLDGMNADEIGPYVAHRLENVGGGDAVSFHDDVWPTLHRFTNGVPRRINRICNRLLINGLFEDKSEFNHADVMEVIKQLDTEGLLEVSQKFAIIHGLVGSNADENEEGNDLDMSAFYTGFKAPAGTELTEEPPHVELTEEPPHVELTEEPPHVELTEEPPHVELTQEPPHVELTQEPPHVELTQEPPHVELTQEPPLLIHAEESTGEIDYRSRPVNTTSDNIDINLDDYETWPVDGHDEKIIPIKPDPDSSVDIQEDNGRSWQWSGTFILMMLGVIAFAGMIIYSSLDSPLFSNFGSENNKTHQTGENNTIAEVPVNELSVKNEYETDVMEVESEAGEQAAIDKPVDTVNPEVIAAPVSKPEPVKPEVVAAPVSKPEPVKPEVVVAPVSKPEPVKPEVVVAPVSKPEPVKPEVVVAPVSKPALEGISADVQATNNSIPVAEEQTTPVNNISTDRPVSDQLDTERPQMTTQAQDKASIIAPSTEKQAPAQKKEPIFTSAQYKFMLQSGFWNKGDSPATLLPSELNKCSDSGSDIFCLAIERKEQSGNTVITYQTGAMIQNFSTEGTFTVLYRSKLNKTDESPLLPLETTPIQSSLIDLKERQMDCRFVNSSLITCIEEGIISEYKRRFISSDKN